MPDLIAAPPGEPAGPGQTRFFPDEKSPERALPVQDVGRLAKLPTAVYAAVCEATASALARQRGVSPAAALVLARDPCVLITHLVLDRLLRLHHLAAGGQAPWRVPEETLEAAPGLARLGSAAASSPEFNQALLGRLAPAWGIASAPRLPPRARKAAAGPANLNFARPGLPRRARWKASRWLSRAWGRVPVLGLAYAESAFLDAGLIGAGRLADLHEHSESDGPALDEPLRDDVFSSAAAAFSPVVEDLLSEWGFDAAEAHAAAGAHASLLRHLFPSSRLESLAPALAASTAKLRRYRTRPLLLSETGDDHTALMLAAAKDLSMPAVGIQHGAHYGFVAAPCHIELELAYLDRFVTWGWTQMPDHPLCRRVEAVPLPSPWLSERRKHWRREAPAPSPGRRSDVLLMTERIQAFPTSLNTVRLNRLDSLGQVSSELRGMVLALTGRNLKVLHKPFNPSSAAALSNASASLRRETGGRYRIHDRLDKGLTAGLLGEASVVVWDEPGSGIFECLVSGIPALLFWSRALYRETPQAEPLFRALEEVRVAHREADSLGEAAAEAARDPAAWINDPRRAGVCAEICRELAWVEDGWEVPWRTFIERL